jgi:diguanylate cyclase (GGDEF)-like protein
MLRSLLPAAIAIIVISGFAALIGQRAGLVGIAVGAGLFAIANAAVVTVAIVWLGLLLKAEHSRRREMQDQLLHHSLHDSLTGLANRGFFMDQLARRAALADRRTSLPFAVCSLVIDGFEHINEQLGHEAGNRILIKVGDVVRDCVRASDLVARIDSDKFGILLEEIADAKDVQVLAQRIVSSVPRALAEMGTEVPVNVSIGIVLKSSGRDLPGDMIRDADAALLEAKKRGAGRFELTAFA